MSGEDRRSILREAAQRLEDAGISNSHKNVEWMMCEVLGCSSASLYANLEKPLSDTERKSFGSMVERRSLHEPLQYVLGFTEFFGLRLSVTPAVLIPRPETEQVVEKALTVIEGIEEPRILDVGTGSGCIALALKSARGDARIWGCDVSESALGVASSNAALTRLSVDFLRLDALAADFVEQSPRDLDLLISNPPYIAVAESASLPPEVRDYEPHLALFAGEDPLVFYRKLAEEGENLLRSNRWLVLETHADFGRQAEEILLSQGYRDVELQRDYAGRSRMLIGRR